jgi:hypothetical protein
MSKTALLFVLVFLLAIANSASTVAPADFAGTWELDKAKTQNPPRPWQNAESVTMTITQTDKLLTIDTKVTGGGPPPGSQPPAGPPPGGPPPGGGRGFGGMMGPASYNLDGSETTTESERGKTTFKATWSNEGSTLELSTRRNFNTPNGEVTAVTTEKLTLSADGKVLTNVRHSEGPRGPQDSTLVFNKKS